MNPLLFLALFTANTVIEIERIDDNVITVTQLHKRVLVHFVVQKTYIHFPPRVEKEEKEEYEEYTEEEIAVMERFLRGEQ